MYLCAPKRLLVAMTLAAGLMASQQTALAQNRLVAGTLTCNGWGNVGLILGSRQHLACVFNPSGTRQRQNYSSRITCLGLDLGIKGAERHDWRLPEFSKRWQV
jgi:hypothetical protein